MRLQGRVFADLLFTRWASVSDTPSICDQRPSLAVRTTCRPTQRLPLEFCYCEELVSFLNVGHMIISLWLFVADSLEKYSLCTYVLVQTDLRRSDLPFGGYVQ